MLSLFPSFLSYEHVAPVLIRLVVSIVFIYWAYKTLIKDRALQTTWTRSVAGTEVIIGVLLFIGLFTQAAALAAAIILFIRLLQKLRDGAFLTDGINYYLIVLVMAISLLFTGPGLLAFDWPL